MSPKNKSRKFNLELSTNKVCAPQREAQAATCVLQYQKSCCRGLGFRVMTRGPYAVSEVCHCVAQCALCQGKAQLIKDQYATSCQHVSPHVKARLINQAQIPARYAHAQLSDFANRTGNCQSLIQKIASWEKRLSQHKERGLLISGPVGVGKTFILSSLAKSIAMNGIRVKFVDFFQLLTQIKACYANNQSEQSVLAPLIDVDVLVIDELGKGRNTDFELTILDQLIMGRYNQQKVIVASTNCTIFPSSPPEV